MAPFGAYSDSCFQAPDTLAPLRRFHDSGAGCKYPDSRLTYLLTYSYLLTYLLTLKPQSNGPLYSNIVIGTLAADGWAVKFGTARRGPGGAASRPGPTSLYRM